MDVSPTMSPDTVSSLFPDRPIRPLPKRRLREKLSPEVAHKIQFPPSTHDAPPLFQYPSYSSREDGVPESPSATAAERRNEAIRNYTPRPQGTGTLDSVGIRSTLVTRSPPEILTRAAHRPVASKSETTRYDTQPPPSTASSIDGYDSFENTNNKKKRKIPSAGDSGHNGPSGLSSDINSLSISGDMLPPGADGADKYYSQSARYGMPGSYPPHSPGMSGPGRGRLGRSGGRSPLRTIPDGNNVWSNRSGRMPQGQWPPEQEGMGIITNAIANAGKHPLSGQENVSLLQQYSSSNKATAASAQFTFTCDSQVPGTLQWPGHANKHNTGAHPEASAVPDQHSGRQQAQGSAAGHRGSGNSRRRDRKRLEKELDMAARHRRQVAADSYYHNPPKPEDIWICEFCEYERIFGEPPRALIREYELKDRRLRQEVAERKRMLEKAKAKARKNKKSAKTSSKANQSSGQTPEQVQTEMNGEQGLPHMQSGGHSTQSEEDYEDDVDEEYTHPPPPPPPPPPANDDQGETEAPLPPWPGPGT
ncbi:hypothetical protein NLU13_0366 [Sarocladium strictum]|uniref:Uncharacterized protein n=1 Tax=Sarocladium strictum TaxID=5046 RepID=A0AA39GNX3_SARSR|nr:hypothetical protein NLU13_0366 [Sarocladium strictum]